MAENKTKNLQSCVAQWVVYEVYRRWSTGESPDIRVSDNKPGKVLVLPTSKSHPNQNTTFQITPKSVTDVMIVVEQDNFQVTQDAATAVTTILSY